MPSTGLKRRTPRLLTVFVDTQQRLVLRFVAAIPIQEATPSQLSDLLAHQLLFIVSIAQALLHGVGVAAHLTQFDTPRVP
ncbi:hypothetical protein [Xanthomonas albilineans]|uniref:hypothetical protein n=1 Tax=Xanthomonas albilineans TaxID=29447 RepID=UPI001392432D|nr:hypothetical protein [Xanthomonas albilineans]